MFDHIVLIDYAFMPGAISIMIAVIGAVVSAIIGATITAFLKAKYEGQITTSATRAQQMAVVGDWEGSGKDSHVEGSGALMDFKVTARFERAGKKLAGHVKLIITSTEREELTLNGGFYDGTYLQFTYQSKDPRRKQMGVVILRLGTFSNTLSGHYTGFSPRRENFVVGQINLFREGESPASP